MTLLLRLLWARHGLENEPVGIDHDRDWAIASLIEFMATDVQVQALGYE